MGTTANGLGASNKSEDVKRKARAERYVPCLCGFINPPVKEIVYIEFFSVIFSFKLLLIFLVV